MQPHDFWQEIHAPATFDTGGPHGFFYPAELDDGRQIRLPIRPLAGGQNALASLIVGRWHPWGAAAACLVFGAAEALEIRMQAFGVPVSSYIIQMAPYLIALAVLAGWGRSAKLPAAIGKPL